MGECANIFFHFNCNSPITANKALEDKLAEMNAATDKSVDELKERIQVLEKELDNANELLSSSKLRGLFPSQLLTSFNKFNLFEGIFDSVDIYFNSSCT